MLTFCTTKWDEDGLWVFCWCLEWWNSVSVCSAVSCHSVLGIWAWYPLMVVLGRIKSEAGVSGWTLGDALTWWAPDNLNCTNSLNKVGIGIWHFNSERIFSNAHTLFKRRTYLYARNDSTFLREEKALYHHCHAMLSALKLLIQSNMPTFQIANFISLIVLH